MRPLLAREAGLNEGSVKARRETNVVPVRGKQVGKVLQDPRDLLVASARPATGVGGTQVLAGGMRNVTRDA